MVNSKYAAALLLVLSGTASAAPVPIAEVAEDTVPFQHRCPNENRVPDSYKDIIDNFEAEEEVLAENVLETKDCSAATTTSVTWAPGAPLNSCGGTYDFSAALDSCCGGIQAENDRTIEATIDFGNVNRPLNTITLDLTVTEELRDCCDDCECWGDPHCSPIGATRRSQLKSFVPCDIAVLNDDGTCSNRIDFSDEAKARCLGEAPGFEHNAAEMFGCTWVADDEGFDTTEFGGPCRPSKCVEMVMFEKEYNMIPGDSTELEGGGGRRLRRRLQDEYFGKVKVVACAGERGVMETVKLVTEDPVLNSDGEIESFVQSSTDIMGKINCNSPMQNGAAMDPIDPDSILSKEFSHMRFNINMDVSVNQHAVDSLFTMEDKVEGTYVHVTCKGGTSTESIPGASLQNTLSKLDGSQVNSLGFDSVSDISNMFENEMKWSSTTDEQSYSTRSAKTTILEVGYYSPKVGSNGGAGFCYDNAFAEYTNANWFSGSASPTQSCPFNNNLDFEDRELIAALPYCQEFLELNNCHNFVDYENIRYVKGKTRRNLNRYQAILEKCIIVYCDQAYIPASLSPLECYTTFYDFGSRQGMALFVPKDSLASANGEEPEASSAIPVKQVGCEESVTVTYESDEQGPAEFVFTPGEPLVIPASNTTPRKLTVVQHSCAGVCGTRPKLDLDVKISTTCDSFENDGNTACFKKDDYVAVKKSDFPCVDTDDFTCA